MESLPKSIPITRIELGNQAQAVTLADFQVKMAMETENLHLDRALVEKAIKYFYSGDYKGSELGIYLVKMQGEKNIGCLLLTFENQKSWWIQSVYIVEQARRKGHFTSLFKEACRLGKEKGVRTIRLYAENDNMRAKATYLNLGMKIIPEKMYSYDFVYGKSSLETYSSLYDIQQVSCESPQLRQSFSARKNLLSGEKYQENDWNYTFSLSKQGQLCALIKTFTEFSDWRFGLAWYIREIYASQAEKQHYQQMVYEIIQHIKKISEPKAAAVRVLFREGQGVYLQGGQLDHYDILEISL